MAGLIGRILGFGLLGLVVTPIVVTLAVLALAYTFDPTCGRPGDSGGCEMGAVSIGVMSALPGMALCIAVVLYRHFRRRVKSPVTPP